MTSSTVNPPADGISAVRHRVGDPSYDVLVALRRIIRATDMHSKRVSKESGLTTAQVVILQSIRDLGEVTTGRISDQVNLSQGTVTTIMDRLEQRGLIERYRSDRDRRVVHARLTETGVSALQKAPPLLHHRFIESFAGLDSSKQAQIVTTLEDVAEMLGVGQLDAAPLLDVGPPTSGA